MSFQLTLLLKKVLPWKGSRNNSIWTLTLPNIGDIVNIFLMERILVTDLFTFHIHLFETFWPNFMAVSLPLLQLWAFFKGRCSQNDDFTVKTLYKRQILEIAVEYEQVNIYILETCQDLSFLIKKNVRQFFTISIVLIVLLLFCIVFKQ